MAACLRCVLTESVLMFYFYILSHIFYDWFLFSDVQPQVAQKVCLIFQLCERGKLTDVREHISQLSQKKIAGRAKAAPAGDDDDEEASDDAEVCALHVFCLYSVAWRMWINNLVLFLRLWSVMERDRQSAVRRWRNSLILRPLIMMKRMMDGRLWAGKNDLIFWNV